MSKKIESNPGGLYIILGGVVLGVGGYFLYKALKGSASAATASSTTTNSDSSITSGSSTSATTTEVTTSSTGFTTKQSSPKLQTIDLSKVTTVEKALDAYLKYFSDMATYVGTSCLKSYSAFSDAYNKVVAAEKGGTLNGAGLLNYAKQWNDYAYAIYQSECGGTVLNTTSSPKN